MFGSGQLANYDGDCSVLGWMKTLGTGLLTFRGNENETKQDFCINF